MEKVVEAVMKQMELNYPGYYYNDFNDDRDYDYEGDIIRPDDLDYYAEYKVILRELDEILNENYDWDNMQNDYSEFIIIYSHYQELIEML